MNRLDIRPILEAVSFAARKHVGHLRKDNATPYIAHPVRVMTILATVFQVEDPEVLAAAVLHDTIEVRLCKLADLYDNLSDAANLLPTSRGRTIAKAQQALEVFSPNFPDEYRWALERFEQQLKITVSTM